MPQTAPYGSWKSRITSDLIVSETIGLGQIALDGDDIYWIESRPSEAGRNVLVRGDSQGEATSRTAELRRRAKARLATKLSKHKEADSSSES